MTTLDAQDDVWSLAVSSSGPSCLLGIRDGTIEVWDAVRLDKVRSRKVGEGHIDCIACEPGRPRIAAVDDTGVVHVLSGPDLQETSSFKSDVERIALAAWDAQRGLLLTGTGRNTTEAECAVELWDPRSGTRTRVLRSACPPVQALAVSDSGDRAIIGFRGQTVTCVRLPDGQEAWSVSSLAAEPTAFRFGDADSKVSIGFSDGSILVASAVDGSSQLRLSGHLQVVRDLRFTGDGRRLFSSSEDGTVRIWDTEFGQPISIIGKSNGVVSAIALSPAEDRLFAADVSSRALVWSARRRTSSQDARVR
jgi:WD40 repeat protein